MSLDILGYSQGLHEGPEMEFGWCFLGVLTRCRSIDILWLRFPYDKAAGKNRQPLIIDRVRTDS